jgi:dipeptide transport system permease protein
MIVYFLRRLALTVPTFVALMFVTFVAIRLVPGDPVEVRVGEHGISPERLAYFRHQLGLDLPVWRQFLDYCWRLLHGDFGVSLSTNQKNCLSVRCCLRWRSACRRAQWRRSSAAASTIRR